MMLEMIRELGYCNGVENYSFFLTGETVPSILPTGLFFPNDLFYV